jgi:transcriptional regulator with XRE-family HTH domain
MDGYKALTKQTLADFSIELQTLRRVSCSMGVPDTRKYDRVDTVRVDGAKLRVLRATMNPPLTQRRLASMAGVSHGYIAALEAGKRGVISRAVGEALASALNAPLSELLVALDTGPASPLALAASALHSDDQVEMQRRLLLDRIEKLLKSAALSPHAWEELVNRLRTILDWLEYTVENNRGK